MTKDQKIKEIREACIRANPEIVELKFGCKVEFDKSYCEYTCVGKDEDYYTYWKDKGDDERHNFTVSERDGWKPIEIIGRDIRLADVLYVIKQNIHEKESRHQLAKVSMSDQVNRLLYTNRWNLLKDNLEDQSEDTISFIHNLLCK